MATIVGIIFGPVALNLFNPFTWGNTDQITLELSRVVLIVQVFAVGVELPKSYMWRHGRSLFLLLGPVMTYGWLVSSAFIYWLIPALSFVPPHPNSRLLFLYGTYVFLGRSVVCWGVCHGDGSRLGILGRRKGQIRKTGPRPLEEPHFRRISK